MRCGEGRSLPSRGKIWGYACPSTKIKYNFLKRGVLVHFERVGMEIALMLQPTVLVFSYCYKPTD